MTIERLGMRLQELAWAILLGILFGLIGAALVEFIELLKEMVFETIHRCQPATFIQEALSVSVALLLLGAIFRAIGERK